MTAAVPTMPLPARPLGSTDSLRGGIWPRSGAVWIAATYLALFVIRPWEQIFPELGEYAFERWMVIATVIVVLLMRGAALDFSRQKLSVLALLIAVSISAMTALYTDLATIELIEFLGTVISFWVIATTVRTPYQLVFLICCYLVANALFLGKSEWEYFVNGAAQYTMGVHRLRGINFTFGHPNSVAATCVVSLPFLLFLFRNKKIFCSSWPAKWQRRFKAFLIGYGALCCSAILLTRSRSGMIAAALFAVLLAWQRVGVVRKAKAFLIAAAVLVSIFVVMPADMRYRLQSTWDPSVEAWFAQGGATGSAWGRWYGFLAGVEMFQRNPLTGAGIGNFKAYRVGTLDGTYLSAHNLPGELMGEMGGLGVLAFLFFLYAIHENCRRLQRTARSSEDAQVKLFGDLGRACQMAMVLLLFNGLSGHNFQRYEWMWIAAFALLAAQFSAHRLKQEKLSAPTRGWKARGAT